MKPRFYSHRVPADGSKCPRTSYNSCTYRGGVTISEICSGAFSGALSSTGNFAVTRSRSRLLSLLLLLVFLASAQTDPGPRPGPASAGGPFEGLNAEEVNLYWAARDRFNEVAPVSGKDRTRRRSRPDLQWQQLRRMSCAAFCRRIQSKPQKPPGAPAQFT